MATRKQNGNNPLEQALAALLQSQAVLTQNQAMFVKRQIESDERFRRIEDDLDQIKAILLRHGQVLQSLPEAIREKVGFKRD